MYDPTTLRLDLSQEEVFESRVYAIRQETLAAAAAAAITNNPDVPPELIRAAFLEGEPPTLRVLATRSRTADSVNAIVVGRALGERTLLARLEGCTTAEFREYVRDFDELHVAGGITHPPLVTDLAHWRELERRQRADEP